MQRALRVKFRTAFWIVAAVVVGALLVFAFRPQPISVDTAEVVQDQMRVTLRDEGRTRVRNEYVVSAPVGGRLLRIAYKPGAAVQAGETVARILPGAPAFLDERAEAEAEARVNSALAALSAAQAELDRAKARAEFAQVEEERTRELLARELISIESYDRVRMELRVAESALSSARDSAKMREAELAAARIRSTQPGASSDAATSVNILAPASGIVLRVAQESESVIQAGAEVMSIGNPDDIEVVVEMLSTDAVQVQSGAEVIIENWGRANAPLAGRVRLVEPYGFLKISALGVEEQRVNVIVDFVGPPSQWTSLGHGYRIEAAIVTWQDDEVVQAPVAALFRRGGEWAVFRVNADRAKLTPVIVGRDNGRNAQILSGLEPGETVVLYPGEQVEDGARLRRRNE